MNKIKIILAMLISVITLSLFTAMPAFALTDGDWEFKLLDNKVTITHYMGEGGDVIIPETIYGTTVTAMEDNVFENVNDTLTSVTFPKTLEVINSLSWYWHEFPKLETVTIPEGVQEIGVEAFRSCKSLKNIVLPSTISKIQKNAFEECISLKQLTIPVGVEYIGPGAFEGSGLEYLDVSHVNISNAEFLFEDCKNLKNVKLYSNMTEIPSCMFLGCSSLESIDIPATVTIIGVRAFAGCSSLKNVILPTSLNKIDAIAFNGSGITELVIPYGTKYIGRLLVETTEFKSIYVPETVTGFDEEAVKNCPNCIVYCTQGSSTENRCKRYSISYLTDNSVNSGITVLYNGTRISFHSYGQNPELLNSRTLVPLRSIFEAMGAEVEWDNATSTAIAKRDGIEIKIQIGANEMYKDGKTIAVDVPAQLMNSRTMVPVRVIAEAFGADVQWNGNGNTVLINE